MGRSELVSIDGCATRCVDADKVRAAQTRLADAEAAARLGDLFKLLLDPHRLRMLSALVEVGELCVCDLSDAVGIPESNVSTPSGCSGRQASCGPVAAGAWRTTRWTTPMSGSCSTCPESPWSTRPREVDC